MIIAIPVDETKTDLSLSFARAPFFLIYNSQSGQKNILSNPAENSQGGAGIKAAQFVVDNGTDALITIRCGENAAQVLNSADIKIYKATDGNAQNNIESFNNDNLTIMTHFHAGFQGIK